MLICKWHIDFLCIDTSKFLRLLKISPWKYKICVNIMRDNFLKCHFFWSFSLVRRLKKSGKAAIPPSCNHGPCLYSGLPCFQRISYFLGFLWLAKESPFKSLLGSPRISKGGGWNFLWCGEQEALNAELDPFLCPLMGHDGMNVQDGTPGSACPQAEGLEYKDGRCFKHSSYYLQMDRACLDKGPFGVTAKMRLQAAEHLLHVSKTM